MTTRYRVARVLARGGVAEVHEAYRVGEEGFERKVALKRLLPELRGDEEAKSAFLDEAKIVSRLHHANIISVFDYGSDEDGPFQVLEFVDGIDASELRERAEEAGLTDVPAELALYITTQVAHALEHAHTLIDEAKRPLRIVHRDVSPENILLSWSGDVKLGDFGIATAAVRTAKTAVGVTKGKLDYMSPEQARADAIDARTDVFGLGCVLHAIVTGRSPLSDEEARRAFYAGGPLPLDAELPPDLTEIVAKATAPSPDDRYQTAGALAADAGAAYTKRSSTEGRTLLTEWLYALRPTSGVVQPVRGGLSELLDFGRVVPPSISETSDEPSEETDEQPVLDPSSMLGLTIGRYLVDELIGYGGSAYVYRVRSPDGQPFALKLLKRGKSATAEERFRREAAALRDLGHPNIVRIVDADKTEDGRPYLVMEHLECKALDRVISERGPFDLEQTIALTRQIASALAAAHGAGFVHRDLKPANILFCRDGSVRLTDFGVARSMATDDATRLTNEDQLLGTPSYMAPEQIRDARSAGPKADLYALGTVMIRLLTGRPPFTGNPANILRAHLQDPPPDVPQAGPLMPLIFDLLAKSPDNRPADAQAVLDRLPKDETKLVPPVRVKVAAAPPNRMARTMLLAVIALMVAFVLGVLFANR